MTIKELCTKYGISLEELGDIGEISDGYHTYNSLYHQRCILFAALCNTFKDLSWKSRKHSDGEECFGGGWFIVGIDTPEGSYTYHYENKYWDLFKCGELDVAKKWDGHTDEDVERLLSLDGPEEKSDMKSWAEREIEIACKHERAGNDTPDNEWDYGCACYESALKAFKSLSGDSHSGFSIGMTKHILNRLIDGKPLTPIEDTDDIWNDVSEYRPEEGYRNYQCKRMSSLFKYVYDNGQIKYKDVNSFYCIDVNTHSTYHSGLVQRIMDEMFPISMPYMPGSPIKVYCSDLLTNRKNGDFDTVAIFYAIQPDGERVEINRFFKEGGNDWVEIDGVEYALRQEMDAHRKENEEQVFKPEFMNKELHIPDTADSVKS